MVDSGKPKRTRLSVDARRDQLTGVGIELIATQSWDDLTMNDIATAAGVSKPLLYHYFSTKRDVYLAAVARSVAQLREATAPDTTLSPEDRLRRSLAVHIAWVDEHSNEYRAILQGGASGDPDVRAIIDDTRDETVRRIVEAFDLDPTSASIEVTLRGWVGFLEGACLAWLSGSELDADALHTLLVASLPAAISAASF